MSKTRLDFAGFDWEKSPLGARFKAFAADGKKIRLVEISSATEHPEWCRTGHVGYLISGDLEIEFVDEIVKFSSGDGLCIPSGEGSKHRSKAKSEKALLFLVDEN